MIVAGRFLGFFLAVARWLLSSYLGVTVCFLSCCYVVARMLNGGAIVCFFF